MASLLFAYRRVRNHSVVRWVFNEPFYDIDGLYPTGQDAFTVGGVHPTSISAYANNAFGGCWIETVFASPVTATATKALSGDNDIFLTPDEGMNFEFPDAAGGNLTAPFVATSAETSADGTTVTVHTSSTGTELTLVDITLGGFTIVSTPSGQAIASYETTGTDAVIHLASPILHGDVVTITYVAGEVIDDNDLEMDNFSSLSVTNNVVTTTDFNLSDHAGFEAGIGISGSTAIFSAVGATIARRFRGTDLVLASYFSYDASGLTFVIDGGSPITPTLTTGSAQTNLTVQSGLIYGWHDVLMTLSGGVGNVNVGTTPLYRVTGTSPAMDYATNYGQFYPIVDNLAHIDLDDAMVRVDANGWANYLNTNGFSGHYWFDAGGECQTTSSYVGVWAGVSTATYMILVNGVPVQDNGFVPTGTGWHRVALATGLGSSMKTVRVIVSGGNENSLMVGLILEAGTFNASYTPPVKDIIAGLGDSMTSGQLVGPFVSGVGIASYNNSAKSWLSRYAEAHGLRAVNRGIGGTTLSPSVTALYAGRTRPADITGLTRKPTYEVFMYGTNQLHPLALQADYAADLNTALSDHLAGTTTTKILVVNPPPASGATEAEYLAMRDANRDVVAALANSRLRFNDITPYHFSGSTYGTDWTTNYGDHQTHFNDAGVTLFLQVVEDGFALFNAVSGGGAVQRRRRM